MNKSVHIGWLLAAILLIGCGAATPTITVPDVTATVIPSPTASPLPPTTPAKGEDGCAEAAVTAADSSAVLTLGPAEGIPATTAKGEPMVLEGVILDERCQPVAGGILHVWQTDADGVYGPGHGTNNMQCCYLQGDVTADSQGRFKLITVRPGLYKGETSPPPAHIHVEGLGAAEGLETEIVFADDPHLTPGLDGLVIDLTKADGITWTGTVVIVVD